MDLREFIAASLQQIIEGVKQAQATPDGKNVNANNLNSVSGSNIFSAGRNGTFTLVQFDVAVSAETGGKGGANLKVLGFGIEGGGEHKHTAANRISFAVPVRLPDGDQARAQGIIGSRSDDQSRWAPDDYLDR